jgi:hypothetical protein
VTGLVSPHTVQGRQLVLPGCYTSAIYAIVRPISMLLTLVTRDNPAKRTLTAAYTSSDQMTLELCNTFCFPYAYAGVEFGGECCKCINVEIMAR